MSDRGDHSFIGVYDTDSPRITYLGPGVDRDTSPTWSPGGSTIAFIRRPGLPFGARADRGDASGDAWPDGMTEARFAGGYDFSIWVGDARTGEASEVWHNPPEDSLFSEARQVMWAGDHIIFQAEPEGWRRYYSVSAEGGTTAPVELTPGDGIAEHISLSPDGRTLFYATNAGDIDRRHLWRVPTAGGTARQLTQGLGIDTYPAVLASGSHVAVLSASASRPLTVAVVPSEGGEAGIIRELPSRFPLDRQVVPEAVTLEAEDGFEFYNQLFLPPDLEPGEQRPAAHLHPRRIPPPDAPRLPLHALLSHGLRDEPVLREQGLRGAVGELPERHRVRARFPQCAGARGPGEHRVPGHQGGRGVPA